MFDSVFYATWNLLNESLRGDFSRHNLQRRTSTPIEKDTLPAKERQARKNIMMKVRWNNFFLIGVESCRGLL